MYVRTCFNNLLPPCSE